ncbi:MAG TPA: MFS transporter [Anaerolineaceae bacterium]|nr:MFS transporter [Anaerolineaceae bacterium]
MSEQPVMTSSWKRTFFLIWTGQAFSLLGSSLVQFALVWWLTQKTGSAMVLTTATLVALLPSVILGPFVGALVDRWNRRRVMIVADGMVAMATAVLVVLFWLDVIQVWHIYVLLFMRSLTGTFHFPAMQASTSLMVPDAHLARISGLNQALRGILNIAAPPLGALLIGLLPMASVLAIDIVTAGIAILPLLFVAIPQPRQTDTQAVTPSSLLRDVAAGLKYVKAWPGLLGLIILAMLLNFVIAPAGTLMPLLVTRHLGGDAYLLGFMESAFGAGVIVGGLILAVWGGFKRRIITSMSGVVTLGAGVLFLSAATRESLWLGLAAQGLMGLAIPFANGPLMAILQSKVAPEMQGRVFTLLESGATAMMPVAMIIAGPVAEVFGVRIWYVIGGAACILIALSGLLVRPIMQIESNGHEPQLAAAAVPETA